MGRLSNRYLSIADNASTTATGTAFFPGTNEYFTNPGYEELELFIRRLSGGSGTLTITLQQFDPVSNAKYDVRNGAGAVLTAVPYTAAELDAAGAVHRLRIGAGILGGTGTTGGLLPAGTKDAWYDYTPPLYWGLKAVESATASVLSITGYLLRG